MTNTKATELSTLNSEVAMAEPLKADFSVVPFSKKNGQRFILYRIGLPSLEITKETKEQIEKVMTDKEAKFVKVGEYTVMLNGISGIDPISRKSKYIPMGSKGY